MDTLSEFLGNDPPLVSSRKWKWMSLLRALGGVVWLFLWTVTCLSHNAVGVGLSLQQTILAVCNASLVRVGRWADLLSQRVTQRIRQTVCRCVLELK